MNVHPEHRPQLAAAVLAATTFTAWALAARLTEPVHTTSLARRLALARFTVLGERPLLATAAATGLILGLVALAVATKSAAGGFGGAPFRGHLRGTRVVGRRRLAWTTRQRRTAQVTVAGVPMPLAVETLHLLVGGSTGSGKSVLIRETARKRSLIGQPSVTELFRWTTIATPQELQAFLAGTAAETLRRLQGAIEKIVSSRVYLLPVHASADANRTLGDAAKLAIEDELQALRAEVEGFVASPPTGRPRWSGASTPSRRSMPAPTCIGTSSKFTSPTWRRRSPVSLPASRTC